MPGLERNRPRYASDDGSAEPAVSAALAAYAAGAGSEYAALVALAGSRLLIPVVAAGPGGGPGPGGAPATAGGLGRAGRHHRGGHPAGEGAQRRAEVMLPALVGNDGRRAVPAFTCLSALHRWRGDVRPVPMPASEVWQTGAAEADAVVIDVAGPVPLAVEGARLAALATGGAVPPVHEDPDIVAAAREAFAAEPAIAGLRLLPGTGGSDLGLHLTTVAASAGDAAAQQAVERGVATLMAAVGDRLRRGVEVTAVGGSAACCAG